MESIHCTYSFWESVSSSHFCLFTDTVYTTVIKKVIGLTSKMPLSNFHRIFKIKRPLRSWSPAVNQVLPSRLITPCLSLSAPSAHQMNTSRAGDSTISLGSQFQCLITLSVKKFFQISNVNLHWCNLRSFPLLLLLGTWERRPTPTSLQPPFRYL